MKKFLSLMILINLLIIGGVFAETDHEIAPITAENGAGLGLVHTLVGHDMAIGALAFHPKDHDVIVSTSRDLSMRIWNIPTGETYLETFPHNAVVNGLAFAPDGETLFSGSWDRTVKRYRVLEGYQLDELPAFVGFSHIVDHVEFSTDGEWVGFGVGDGSLHVLNTGDFTNRKIFLLDGLIVSDFAFLPTNDRLDEQALFVISMGFPEDQVLFGRFADDELVPLEHGHLNGVTALAVKAWGEGWLLATGGDDGAVNLWQIGFDGEWTTPESLGQIIIDGAWFTTMTFNPAGDVLVTGTHEGDIYVYDVRDPVDPQLLTVLDELRDYPIQTLTFSHDGTRLAGGGEVGQIFVWES